MYIILYAEIAANAKWCFRGTIFQNFFGPPGGLARSALGSRTLHNSTALLIRSNIFLDPPLPLP